MLIVTCSFFINSVDAISIQNQNPVVVSTFPISGTENVDPNISEIKIVFSKDMLPSYSFVWINKSNFPEIIGDPKWIDKKTIIINVKLEPNKTYAIKLNSKRFRNFKDENNNMSYPYLLIFKTKSL